MRKLIYFFIFLFLIGCGYNIPTPSQRLEKADKLAGNKFKKHIFNTKEFKIFSYEGNLKGCKKVYVYIEGDGLSWITSDLISSNPTPLNPEGLKLALNDRHKCVVYLARPCQYVNDKQCNYKYWTDCRFSKKVISSYQDVLNQLKNKYDIKSFVLIGYSGGGAVAALISAFRNDVSMLVTVAGNLDTKKWCEIHHLTPLTCSLNPADFTDKLENIKQLHLIGGSDNNIKKAVFFSYYDKFKNKKNIKYLIIKNYKHNSDWSKILLHVKY